MSKTRSKPTPPTTTIIRETIRVKKAGKPALSAEQQAAVKAIRDRSKTDRTGPDKLTEGGEIDELVPQAQYIAVRALSQRHLYIAEVIFGGGDVGNGQTTFHSPATSEIHSFGKRGSAA